MNYEEILEKLINENNDIIVMTAENLSAIRNLSKRVPNNFLDVGIAEMSLVGTAAGLALRGRKPIIHALAPFLLYRAFEFIRTDIGYGNLPVVVVGTFTGFLSTANGPTHQAIEDIALMSGIPNMNVFAPADIEDLNIGIAKIIKSNKPFYVRFNELAPIYKHSENFEIGKSEIIREGKDINLLTYGTLFKQSYLAMQKLNEMGYDTGLINLRTVKPIDEEEIIILAKNSKLLVTVEDHLVQTGLYSIISKILVRNHLNCNVLLLGLNDWFKTSADLDEIIDIAGFNENEIINKIILNIK